MQWTDDVRIETPEQIDVSLEIAGLGSRFVAQLLDWLIKWGTLFCVAMVLLIVAGGFEQLSFVVQAVVVALFYVFLLGFDIYFELKNNGQTPGKKTAGIRVVREGGASLDFTSACLRNVLGLVDFLPAFYLLGALIAMLTPRGQRLGDLVAGTVVIRERVLQPPAELDGRIQQMVRDEFAFTPDQLRVCTSADLHVLRSFFQRDGEMEPDPRRQLALRLTQTFLQKTGYQPASPIGDGERAVAFLATLYQSVESWLKHNR
jgi:uncharacterized RDD family membrane protein YckC